MPLLPECMNENQYMLLIVQYDMVNKSYECVITV